MRCYYCRDTNVNGNRCRAMICEKSYDFCSVHMRCKATTKKGKKCKNERVGLTEHCSFHTKQREKEREKENKETNDN